MIFKYWFLFTDELMIQIGSKLKTLARSETSPLKDQRQFSERLENVFNMHVPIL